MGKYYALIPAAGSGSRMGGETPKQYLPLNGKPMIYHALATFCAHPGITRVYVVLAPDDALWQNYDWSAFSAKLTVLRCGGAERCETVNNGLAAISQEVGFEDWVLVHDAARPCLTRAHLSRLIAELRDDEVGGILAVPVADTLKRTDDGQRITRTEERTGLWQAQTPQMFRAGLLAHALQQCSQATDEASAVEALGLKPKLVLSESDNFKVTYPQDLLLAELLLNQQGNRA